MMSRVTKKDVMDAAKTITLSGSTPSVVNIRDFLGRGSNSTISKLLNEWRRELVTQQNTDKKNDQNDEVRNLEAKMAKLLAEQEKIQFELKSQFEKNIELKNKAVSLEEECVELKNVGEMQKAELEKYQALYHDIKSERQYFEQEKIKSLIFEKQILQKELKALHQRFNNEFNDLRTRNERDRVGFMMAKYRLKEAGEKLDGLTKKNKKEYHLDPIKVEGKLNQVVDLLYFLTDKKVHGASDE